MRPLADSIRHLCLLGAMVSCITSCGAEVTSRCGPENATVTHVIDGDTIEIEGGARVRYLLVDTPEVAHRPGEQSQCFGPEAKTLNEQLVSGRDVDLEYDVECTDDYDRLLAYVLAGRRMINRLLVERGYAKVMVIPPNGEAYKEEFRQLEQAAKEEQLGLWWMCQ